ncbi:MAG: hypothetical protein ACTSRG_14420 [Candidatus Helarchaeota archaeon]
MNAHKQIKGSILIKDNGMHISSDIALKNSERRKISAHVATIFRYISKKNKAEEAKIHLENGINLYIKRIPSKKLLLTTITDNATSPILTYLMHHYSNELKKIFV